MYKDPQAERMSQEELRELQLDRIKKTVKWAYEKSAFYKQKFDEAGVSPADIEKIADIEKFPFTTKRDILENSAHDFLTLPFSGISRISQLPDDVIRMYTAHDIALNVEMMARALVSADINKTSVVGILGDLSDNGLMDSAYALEVIGATMVPLSDDYERAMKLIELTHIDTMIGSSRKILRLVIQFQAAGKEISEYSIKRLLCFNETMQNPLKGHIGRRTGAEVYNFYVSSAFGCAGMMYQCSEHYGFHLNEDCFYSEIAAFGRNDIIHENNSMGELVLTALCTEGVPIIRYRTGETATCNEVCACGRSFVRLTTPLSSFG